MKGKNYKIYVHIYIHYKNTIFNNTYIIGELKWKESTDFWLSQTFSFVNVKVK